MPSASTRPKQGFGALGLLIVAGLLVLAFGHISPYLSGPGPDPSASDSHDDRTLVIKFEYSHNHYRAYAESEVSGPGKAYASATYHGTHVPLAWKKPKEPTLGGGARFDLVATIPNYDGSPVLAEFRGTPVPDKSLNGTGLTCTVTDSQDPSNFVTDSSDNYAKCMYPQS